MAQIRASEAQSQFGDMLAHDMTILLKQSYETGDTKLPVKVIGWITGKFFLTTCPHINGSRLKIKTGIEHDIVFIRKGKVYGFRTHLYREVQTMVPLLLFSYPSEIELVELRKEPRYNTFFATDIGSETDGILELFKGTIVNLSKSGCLIKLSQFTPWEVDHDVNISFDMPTDNQQYNLTGAVRAIKRSKDTETLGVQFYDPPESFLEQLNVIATVAEEAF